MTRVDWLTDHNLGLESYWPPGHKLRLASTDYVITTWDSSPYWLITTCRLESITTCDSTYWSSPTDQWSQNATDLSQLATRVYWLCDHKLGLEFTDYDHNLRLKSIDLVPQVATSTDHKLWTRVNRLCLLKYWSHFATRVLLTTDHNLRLESTKYRYKLRLEFTSHWSQVATQVH